MSLISGHSQSQSAYVPTLWAEVLHNAPHVNITLHPVDNMFNPENDLYLESIGILASIPAAWLITTLVVLLIYLCTRCCDTKSRKKRKSRPMRCCLSFFALITCVALALGFLGNEIMHEGMQSFHRAAANINNIIKRSQAMTKRYNENIMNNIEKNANRLYEGPFQSEITTDKTAHFEIMDAYDGIFGSITKGLEAMDELRFTITDLSVNERHAFRLDDYAYAFEKYRWSVTIALQALFALFCLLLLIGAIIHSRCVLIIFSVCGLFSIIILWMMSSVYTATAVALADFCYEPTPWVKYILYRGANLDSDVTSYYLECAPGKSNPFEAYLSKSTRAINDIDQRVRVIAGRARKYYSPLELSPFLDDLEQNTDETMQLMSDLSTSLRCEQIFRSYNTALVAMCDRSLLGLILMWISVSAAGLLFTLLVWCNSHTWIYFKHKGRYIKVDDADPYMPLSTIERPRLSGPPPPSSLSAANHMHNYGGGGTGGTLGSSAYGYAGRAGGRATHIHTPPQTPPYHGTLNGHTHSNAPTLRSGAGMGPAPYGHQLAGGPPTLQRQKTGPGGNMLGTLGRNTQSTNSHGGYQGLDHLPATMTLGRRGHYASGGRGGVDGVSGRSATGSRHGVGAGDTETPLLGPNMGQYATLSKQCKTLESSDFY